jgi:protein involved in polysaccharide export with SLBB domain
MATISRPKLILSLLPGLLAITLAGCASLTSTTVGLDSYDLPQGQFAMDGSSTDHNGDPIANPLAPPTELSKVSLPNYVIEAPDVLLIEGVKLTPKTPYAIQTQDIVQIVVLGTTPDRPIASQFLVEPSGIVNLGPGYPAAEIAGLTTKEAEARIRELLNRELSSVDVAVSLFQTAGQQLITGEHLVAPDGTVNLGLYGRVYVAGMTMDDAREAVEERLNMYFDDPKISLDIFIYNSKWFYIISSGGGLGDQVIRVPVTGNETVLDAMAQIGGFGQASSTRMWISRPTPTGTGCDQVLPIDWHGISRGAGTQTNYQLLPGDRLFIAENRLFAVSNLISTLLRPLETITGFTLLSSQTVQQLQRFPEGFRQF